MGKRGVCTGFLWEHLREIDHWGEPGIDEKIILKWIFRGWDVGVWTGVDWLRIEKGGTGNCECGNEPSGSIKCREFLDWLQTG
jgi:hypothetical protein